MFLHCHKCGWEQDDFWSKDGYNPFRQDIIDWLRECLFKDRIMMSKSEFDDWATGIGDLINDIVIETETEKGLSGKDYVAIELIRISKSIFQMNVPTNEEWQQIKDEWLCPRCGSDQWDVD